jgi:hypothetical protein
MGNITYLLAHRCACQLINVYTTILRLSIIILQKDKVKDCDRHPPQYVRVQVGKLGKVYLDDKGARPQ